MRTPCTLLFLTALLAACTPDTADDATGADDLTLVGPTWEWQISRMGDDSEVTPDDPAKYTASFADDGTVHVVADCNTANGDYESEGGSLTIGPLATTLAMCPPESESDEYLRQLQSAASYIIEDGRLHVAMIMDSGIMEFAPAE